MLEARLLSGLGTHARVSCLSFMRCRSDLPKEGGAVAEQRAFDSLPGWRACAHGEPHSEPSVTPGKAGSSFQLFCGRGLFCIGDRVLVVYRPASISDVISICTDAEHENATADDEHTRPWSISRLVGPRRYDGGGRSSSSRMSPPPLRLTRTSRA